MYEVIPRQSTSATRYAETLQLHNITFLAEIIVKDFGSPSGFVAGKWTITCTAYSAECMLTFDWLN